MDMTKMAQMDDTHKDAKMLALGLDGLLLPTRIWTLTQLACAKCGSGAVRLRAIPDSPEHGPHIFGACAGCGDKDLGMVRPPGSRGGVDRIGTVLHRVSTHQRVADRMRLAGKDPKSLFGLSG